MKGMTLLEVLLYIGIFSLIFTGFIIFTFEFSKSISISTRKAEEARISMLVSELARWRYHHLETVTDEDFAHMLRFEQYSKPANFLITNKKCPEDALNDRQCVFVNFIVGDNKKSTEVVVPSL
jgi:hypothetical protein